MNIAIIQIVNSCDTIREVRQEFNTWKGFFRFKDKKECKSLENSVHNKILSLADDKWTVGYLYGLQDSLVALKTKLGLGDSYKDLYISESVLQDSTDEEQQHTFHTMYFKDINRDNQIILDIIGDNITFTIFDNNTGSTFSASSRNEVQPSQQKIESVCKQRVIDLLERYFYDATSIKSRKSD